MSLTKRGKGQARAKPGPSKKRRLDSGNLKNAAKPKERAFERNTIPIPDQDDEVDLSDQDLEILDAYGTSVSFLDKLDQEGIARSKKETERLHKLNKPFSRPSIIDDLPSVDFHEDDGGPWSSDVEENFSVEGDVPSISDSVSEGGIQSDYSQHRASNDSDSDIEMAYETVPRKRRPSWDLEEKPGGQRLPIKLPDGRLQKTGRKNIAPPVGEEDSDDESEDLSDEKAVGDVRTVEDVSTGARFGRRSVVDVVSTKSRKARIQAAKEQIAGICQDILAEPENSLGLLRRLRTFSSAEISTPAHPDPIANDILIRKLSILSELVVFKDIIPGYRIRPLTDKEKAEKVSQMVARTREWEQGLVIAYQSYLRSLEAELKAKGELAEVCLRCICTLAVEATHFNFSTNLMSCIISRLGRKSWDKSSDHCLDTVIKVFRADLTGISSLEIVRFLNRTIKEKRFNVHPNILSCLLHLRLKTELGAQASESQRKKEDGVKSYSKRRAAERRARGKSTDQPHLSKKMKKALKEKKEIDKELREAEAEVDKEARTTTHTETLKLLFVLYFKILKNPKTTPLLPAALQGISKYAHLVNIDFFADLMQVLKDLISRESEQEIQGEMGDIEHAKTGSEIQHQLLCIVTAFELLSGQGEALNIDLHDFITRLYAIILPTSLHAQIESPLSWDYSEPKSIADLLFRALTLAFSSSSSSSSPSSSQLSAAFAKRLLSASLHWPPPTTLRALSFVRGLLRTDPTLDALLPSHGEQERYVPHRDGVCVYRPDVDDPNLSNPFASSLWELDVLRRSHWHPRVREEAEGLAKLKRS